jgi:hypothetical protein
MFSVSHSLGRLVFSLGLMFLVMRGTLCVYNSHFLTIGLHMLGMRSEVVPVLS